MNRIPPLEFLSGTPKEAKTKKERGSPESQGFQGCGSFKGRDRFGSHDMLKRDDISSLKIMKLPSNNIWTAWNSEYPFGNVEHDA